ncbi:glutathionylspermidine synthase family protein [Lapillicoccus sp.]|uniref:glutathionylspermidine synthase family protein n=1 Tax=Lapillicoccus sp. TaxID=1909287 RepID=UPI0039834FC1
MDRHDSEPRQGWPAIIEEQGLIYWKTPLPDGEEIAYWHEGAHYSLTSDEVYDIEAVARLMLEMLVEAGDYIIEENLFAQLGIPGWAVPRIKETWESEPPMLYGRFDFAYGHDGVPRLLEYNADTPTGLLETAAVQWHWAKDVFGEGVDQWNLLHEMLVGRWRELAQNGRLPGERLHMLHTSAEQSGEDFMTIGYLAETARAANLMSELVAIESLGHVEGEGFVDLAGRPVRTAFKLYPWEWMVREDFGTQALEQMGDGPGQTVWIEPIWKMLWSNKGILPVLHRLFPENPHVLPAYFDGEQPDSLTSFVRKPLLAREGANATAVIDGKVVEEGPDQDYGAEGFVVQEYTDLGDYGGGARPVLGVWTVDVEPAGLGIRESDGLLTTNTSRFVPHVIS